MLFCVASVGCGWQASSCDQLKGSCVTSGLRDWSSLMPAVLTVFLKLQGKTSEADLPALALCPSKESAPGHAIGVVRCSASSGEQQWWSWLLHALLCS